MGTKGRRNRVGWVLALGATLQAGCTAPGAEVPPTREPASAVAPEAGPAQHGLASYYAARFRNRRTASGAPFDPASDTAAHRSLPLGSLARVTNLANGRSATVTIRDRGPHTPGRILDVSPRIADELSMRQAGVARVAVEPLQMPGRSLLVPTAAAAEMTELAEAAEAEPPRPAARAT
ncbi:septal ring lytic transglycosylase RlpA family protein, partial [Plastoroseomonas hellenica]|uniref:septal ring lytic transglycosylase RlpA family protein n=1 Tax=Plastoroseomonas hellenica TaxID=2687306 RepID=UPI001BA7C0FA